MLHKTAKTIVVMMKNYSSKKNRKSFRTLKTSIRDNTWHVLHSSCLSVTKLKPPPLFT